MQPSWDSPHGPHELHLNAPQLRWKSHDVRVYEPLPIVTCCRMKHLLSTVQLLLKRSTQRFVFKLNLCQILQPHWTSHRLSILRNPASSLTSEEFSTGRNRPLSTTLLFPLLRWTAAVITLMGCYSGHWRSSTLRKWAELTRRMDIWILL